MRSATRLGYPVAMRKQSSRFTVYRLYSRQTTFELEPPYQREGGLWGVEAKQSFIDSVINGWDVPKLYLAECRGGLKEYAVIDGKQRLTTLWSFMKDEFRTADDFQADEFPNLACSGKLFSELAKDVQDCLLAQELDFVILSNCDEETVEEMFHRLNNGVPLNNAEKRNAIGGALNQKIKELVSTHDFFRRKITATTKRSAYLETAAKFYLIEERDGVCDLKKRPLDNLVRAHKMPSTHVTRLHSAVKSELDALCKVFSDADALLRRHAAIPLYYLLYRRIRKTYAMRELSERLGEFLEAFEVERELDRKRPDDDRDSTLQHFELLSQQATASRDSLDERLEILTKRFLERNSGVRLKDPRRDFNKAERHAIWVRGLKACAFCGRHLELDEMHADHVREYSAGGTTTLENARCLCVSCNTSRRGAEQ
jgi:hypothetical protein